MSLSYKTFGKRIYIEDKALRLQQSGPDVQLTLEESKVKPDENMETGSNVFYALDDFSEQMQIQIVFGQMVKGPNVDNASFLTFNEQQTIIYLDSLGEITKGKINSIFSKILKLEEIDPSYVDFFSLVSSYASNLSQVSKLRSKIIKQTGDSDFIKKEFGIEDFFTLQDFEDRIASRIKDEIKRGADLGVDWDFNKRMQFLLIPDKIDDKYIVDYKKNLLKLRSSGRGQKMIGWGKRQDVIIQANKLSTTVYESLETRAGKINENPFGTTTIPYKELLESEIYQNPVRFDIVDAFVDDGTPSKVQDIYPYEELKASYNPRAERIKWENIKQYWGYIDSKNIYGIDEIIFGYYIQFIDILQVLTKDSKDLELSIGEFFTAIADKAYPYIMHWVIAHYENLVRYNLARIVEATDPTDLNATDAVKDALNQAEELADLDLQGMQGDLEDDELSEEDIQQRQQLYKQCALLLNMKNLKEDFKKILVYKKENNDPLHTNDYYNNRFYMIEDPTDQLSVKNKLISPTGQIIKPFMEITPDIASALRPRLRLFKIYYDNKEKKTVSFEFPFPSHTNRDRVDIFNGKDIDRGDGLGIKSFNFSFDGETPATSQKYISADLTLFFQSFQDFVKERSAPNGRSDGKEEKFRYVDLFVNTKYCPRDNQSTSPLHYDPSYYRLRVDVGWEPRNDDAFDEILRKRGYSAAEFNKAINSINKSFYLNLIDHEINIGESGTVTISANYMAYIEGLMDQNNVLLSKEAAELQSKNVDEYERQLKTGNCDEFKLAELRASINAIKVTSRRILHQSLIDKLGTNGCIYYTHVNEADKRQFSSKRFFSKTPTLKTRNETKYAALLSLGTISNQYELIASSGTEEEQKPWNYLLDEYVMDPKKGKLLRISFFYLADLAYFLLDSLYEDDRPFVQMEEQIKAILSSFSINIPYDGDHHINIGEIPIEIEVFTKWYKENIVDKKLDSISFLEFIRRLAFYLITDVFGEICIDEQQHKRLSFMTAAINSTKIQQGEKGIGTLQEMLDRMNEEDGSIIDISRFYSQREISDNLLPLPTSVDNLTNLNPSDFVQYLLLYPHHRPETHFGRGKAIEDAKRGVHHLYIGANKGILKNVSFSKTDIQYLRESRMLTQGQSGLLQLSSVYRANIKMIGNTIFYPGMLLFINPFGFGGMDFGLPQQGPGTLDEPILSNIMGIGGYQKVVKVSSTISESGKFETDVECIFEHTGEPPINDGEAKDNRSPTQRTGRGQQDIRRITCKDLDNIQTSGDACDATTASKDLQNTLRDINKKGNIDEQE
jgi:hypothetical protein